MFFRWGWGIAGDSELQEAIGLKMWQSFGDLKEQSYDRYFNERFWSRNFKFLTFLNFLEITLGKKKNGYTDLFKEISHPDSTAQLLTRSVTRSLRAGNKSSPLTCYFGFGKKRKYGIELSGKVPTF